jgi:glyoxylase-like metal-dependent hydrolase (beta-lactamase superfamily II)
MTLEDHVGDIIGKARNLANVTLEAAARAAGVSPGALSELESQGRCASQPNYQAVAKLLGLEGARLERIANGWLPQTPDLSQWRELRCITTAEGGMSVHCYLIWDEVTRAAALFDTGFEAGLVFQVMEENGLQLKHLFITHSHFDHVGGLEAVREKFPQALLHTSSKHAPPQHRNRANDFIQLGSLRITNRDTPGHADDGVTYIIGNWPEDAPYVAVVGDAIFAGSMGRVAGANGDLAKAKIRQQILSLPPETLICPGHGPLTTVAQEQENNPFFP